ncbi:hypothetical protein [Niastella populi]|uniref:Uncharacterized protein n=1 Tax=Niastella populi TaxID=550983 RepID=A0A1V9F5Q6_9BACT|nr:hypothetical protein [Niastella populi]OQP53597.1 hypothetical protein A4R26_06390 [Niastella populi]
MVQILLYIIPVFIVYQIIRGWWVSNETLKAKYKLDRLKDELTWLAISGEVNRENKVYIHLSNNIDKALIALPRFNFWVMLYILIRGKYQINIQEIEKVHNEAETHAMLKEIYNSYHKVILAYIARKNCITVLLSFPIWKKLLTRQLTVNEHDHTCDRNTDVNDEAQEYSAFVFYFQNISAKSLLAG